MGVLAATFVGPDIPFTDLLPPLVWLGAVCTLLLLGTLLPKWPKGASATVTVSSSVAVVVLQMVKWHDLGREKAASIVADAVSVDRFSVLATITVAIALGLVALVTHDYLQREDNDGPELYAMFILSLIHI